MEVASAVYGISFALDVSGIGMTSLVKLEEAVDRSERTRRVKVALGALQQLFTGIGFGAKLSRFTPIKRVISAVATITHPHPFVASPPQLSGYTRETIERLLKYQGLMSKLGIAPEVRAVVYGDTVKQVAGIHICSSIEEFFEKLIVETLTFFERFG